MVDKNMLLVNLIEKFPCLYNTNLSDYSKKDVTDRAWNDIASQTQLSVAECKEKWKNLRYGLLRSMKPHPDGTIKKKYYLHDEMEFVLPFLKYSKQYGTIATALDEDTDEDISANIIENEEQMQYFESESNQIEPPTRKARMSNYKSIQQKSQYYMDSQDNPRTLFLLSLLPEVNALTEGQMKMFRRKVFQLLDDIVGSDSEQADSNKNLICNKIKTESL